MHSAPQDRTDPRPVARPSLAVRFLGWLAVGLLLFGFVVWPLWNGRWYGFGQAILYCFLIVLGAWIVHWTHRVVRLEDGHVRLESPVHCRSVALEGLRVEVRVGWWTRIVLIPSFGISTSLIRPLWQPDPVPLLESGLPPEAFRTEVTPALGGPGPEEEGGPELDDRPPLQPLS
jgi:hypothetical protein